MGTLTRRYVYLDENNPIHIRILTEIDRQSNKSAYIARALERGLDELDLKRSVLEDMREIIRDELNNLQVISKEEVKGETDDDNNWLSDLAL